MQEFATKFRLDELTISRHGGWRVSIHPTQPTVGALVVSLDRPCESLGELSEDEGAALVQVFADIEASYATTYRPDRVNYLALMMLDAQVHFHVLPRYAEDRTVEGTPFTDPGWPGPPEVTASTPVSSTGLEEITATLAATFE